MKDKTIPILFVLIIGFVIFVIDHQAMLKGEVSPVRRILSRLGVTGLEQIEKYRISGSDETQELSVAERLLQFEAKRIDLNSQKKQLVQARKWFLTQLIEANEKMEVTFNDVKDTSVGVERQLISNQHEFLKINSDFEQLWREPDRDLQIQYFRIIKEQIIDIFEQNIDDYQEDIPNLPLLFDAIEKILAKDQEVLNYGCQDFENCFNASIDNIQEEFRMLTEQISNGLGEVIENFDNDLRNLKYDYTLYQNNAHATDLEVEIFQKRIDDEILALHQKPKMTEKHFTVLMLFYEELELEKRIYFNNLQLNKKRMKKNHTDFQNNLNYSVQVLNSIPKINIRRFVSEYSDYASSQNELMKKWEGNEAELMQNRTMRGQESQNLLKFMAKIFHINIQKIINSDDYIEKKKARIIKIYKKWEDSDIDFDLDTLNFL